MPGCPLGDCGDVMDYVDVRLRDCEGVRLRDYADVRLRDYEDGMRRRGRRVWNDMVRRTSWDLVDCCSRMLL